MVQKLSGNRIVLWATLRCLPASPDGNWGRSSALGAPLSTEAAGGRGLRRGETKRGGFPESHPVPLSSLPALGLCDLEREEAGLGCSSQQPVSLLPPGGPASERTLQEHPRSGGCPRQEGGPGVLGFHFCPLVPIAGLALGWGGRSQGFYSGKGLLSYSRLKGCSFGRGDACIQIQLLLL